MGFFIGWRYFEEKDRYGFEATQERDRLRRENANKQRKADKKRREARQAKRAKKEALKEEWRAEQAEYQKALFGEQNEYAYSSNSDYEKYKTGDMEQYKEEIARRFGTLYHSSDEKKAPRLGRGMGPNPHQEVRSAKEKTAHSSLGPMGQLQKKRPVGMAPTGMDKNEAVQAGNDARGGPQGGGLGGGGAGVPPKLTRPF